MSWKEKVVGLYKRFGTPVKFAAKLVLGSVVPGGSAVVDLVGLALDCVHETVRDQIELDEAKMPAATAADLQRLEDMLAVLGGADLGGLMAKVAALESRPDLAAQTLALAEKNDAGCQAALQKLDQLARGIEGLHGKADQMNAKLDELLRRNHVPPGSQPQYHVSINDEKEKQFLLWMRNEYRILPPEGRRVVDLGKLGDALRAAGLPAEAKETYAEAAAQTTNRAEQAANHYKAYLADLEQRRWDDALAAIVKAGSLDAKFALFPIAEYAPKRIVGAGGFGAAFLCHDPHMDQQVVVKSLHETELDRNLTNVFGEAKVLLQLSRTHPVIIGVQRCSYADVTAKLRPYIVMDYFPGVSLQNYLDQMKTPLGLALPDFLAIAVPVAKGMRAVHARGVFHRDLKPDNVLVLKKGERWNLRIIDFGLAVRGRVVSASVNRPVSERNYLGAGVAGTAKYAPPEQMGELPDVAVGPYSDVFAFAKLCLYMLFKTTDPKNRHWQTLPAEARDGLRELLEKCTEHLPADRHPSFDPVVQCLEALTSNPPAVSPAEAIASTNRPGRGNPAPTVETPSAGRGGVSSPAPPQAIPIKPGDIYFNALGMKFAWIPPGSFLMGSPANEPGRSDDETQHGVTLTKGFHLGVHQVTQAQWQAVMGSNPSHFKGESNLPVENVSWEDSVAFCEALGKKDGKKYRLPSEAEWEYACRAGTTTPFHFGATISVNQANYDGNYTYGAGKKGIYRQKTTPVGSFPANAWGLFDMHGNVWEWCADWFGPYPEGELKDPQEFIGGDSRVCRGGSWFNDPGYCRSAFRGWIAPANRYHYLGLRVCPLLDS